jgi:hypothetical protein
MIGRTGIGANGVGGVDGLLNDGGEYEGGEKDGGRLGGLLRGDTDGEVWFIKLAHGFFVFELRDTNPGKLNWGGGDTGVGVVLRGVELRLCA